MSSSVWIWILFAVRQQCKPTKPHNMIKPVRRVQLIKNEQLLKKYHVSLQHTLPCLGSARPVHLLWLLSHSNWFLANKKQSLKSYSRVFVHWLTFSHLFHKNFFFIFGEKKGCRVRKTSNFIDKNNMSTIPVNIQAKKSFLFTCCTLMLFDLWQLATPPRNKLWSKWEQTSSLKNWSGHTR